MKIRDIMTANPACCLPNDSAKKVASMLRDNNVGSLPVVQNHDSKKLVGIITDRDLCCSIVAEGLDPNSTQIERFLSTDVVSCRDGENLDRCETLMQEHQVRRIPIVDRQGAIIGIVAQADLALRDKPEKVSKTVAEISKPENRSIIAA